MTSHAGLWTACLPLNQGHDAKVTSSIHTYMEISNFEVNLIFDVSSSSMY